MPQLRFLLVRFGRQSALHHEIAPDDRNLAADTAPPRPPTSGGPEHGLAYPPFEEYCMPRLTPLRRAVVSFPLLILLVAGAAQAAVVRTFSFTRSDVTVAKDGQGYTRLSL